MLIEVLCEDLSFRPILEKVLGDIVSSRNARGRKHELHIHPHRGKGYIPKDLYQKPKFERSGILDMLPAKLRAYQRCVAIRPMLVVVVLDADDDDPDQLYQNLEFQIRKFNPDNLFVIGIAVEEMEAWLMGDWTAIVRAYPDANHKAWKRYKQDSVEGTWEALADVTEGKKKRRKLEEEGYPAVGSYKYRWATRISRYIDPVRNESPSFRKFYERFQRILDRAEEREQE